MKINQLKLGAVLSYIIIGLDLIIGLIYTPILTKTLGQSQYGLYSLVSSTIAYLTLLDLGFGSAIVVYTTRYKAKGNKEKEQRLHGMFFLIYLLIGLIAGILGYVLYLNVNNMFGNSMTSEEIEVAKVMMLILTGNLIVTFPMSIFSSIITAYEKFVFSKLLNICRLLISPIITIIVLKLGYRAIGVVTVATVLNVLVLIINMIYCIKKLDVKFKFGKFDFKLLAEIFSFSFFIFLSTIVDKISWNVDQFILGVVCGTIAVAVYNIASQLNTIYISFSTAISGILLPRATQMQEENATDKEFTNFFIKIGRIQYIVMALVITGFVLYGKEFVLLWQGESYIKAYYIACILMIPSTVMLIQNSGVTILQAKNKYRFRTLVYFFIAIANVFISIPLAQKYEGIGSAMGTALALVIGNIIIMNIYYYKKINIDIPEFWKQIFKMSIPLIPVVIIGILTNKFIIANNYLLLLLKIIIYTSIYIVAVWKFSMNDYEKNLFGQPVKKILKIKNKDKKKEYINE